MFVLPAQEARVVDNYRDARRRLGRPRWCAVLRSVQLLLQGVRARRVLYVGCGERAH